MTAITAHTTWMTQRQLKALVRQPAYLIIQIIQPAIWQFLFGSLFRKVAELPGFGAPSYLDYLVPGVVVMSALSTSMWSGMTVLEEIDRGIMDRFLSCRCGARRSSTPQSRPLPGRRGRPDRAAGGGGPGRRGVQRAVQHHRDAGPGAGDHHRPQRVPAAAADLPVHGVHVPGPDAALDADRGGLQPGQLGARSLESGDEQHPGLGPVLAQGGALLALAVAVTALSVLTFRAYQKSV